MEGLWAMFGEYELAYYGLSKEQLLKSLYIGFAVSMFIGSFLGVLSDLLGHRKFCLLFYMLHLSVSIWKIVSGSPTIWLASICLSLASSIYYFSFETLMVVEHDKADGREVSLGLIYPCFLGSKMLGSTGFPWLFHGPLAIRIEEYLMYAFIIMGIAITVVAYDYQRGYYQCIGNSTIIAFAALGLFSAAGCMYTLKRWGKQLHQSKHNL
ncbi:UNVERIFIED_CONTAM: hypothetical protein Sradi_4202800 [Sesamum radiatum]|uniref:Major facilitator superfamily protein n=1 Tax=Sesamum radiatum TaxID=300843 RepID=A0AAW2P4V7_SESRA